MKKFLLFICCLCSYSCLFSQSPVLDWVKSIGGSNVTSSASKLDLYGHIYVSGKFSGTVDFDPGVGQFSLTSGFSGIKTDIFIAKFDTVGNFIWVKNIGANNGVNGNPLSTGIAIDSIGNVYCTGFFNLTVDFDPGVGIANLTAPYPIGEFPHNDAFVLKLDSAGNYLWAKQFTGYQNELSYGIALDRAGNVYTTGYFSDTVDFNPSSGVFNLISMYNIDGFVSKLDANGNFVWAKQIGGAAADFPKTITCDDNGNIYTAGFFNGTCDFDPGVGTYQLTSHGNSDAYLSKLDANGNFVWAKHIGSINPDAIHSVTTDFSNNVYIAGSFQGTVDMDPNTGVQNHYSLNENVFISKLNSSGNLIWSKNIEGSGNSYPIVIDIDMLGNVYTTGKFSEKIDLDPSIDSLPVTSVGQSFDVYINKLDSMGNFIWAKTFGGPADDISSSLFVNQSGSIYSTGSFNNTADFDPNSSIANISSIGGYNTFMHKMKLVNLTVDIAINDTNSSFLIYPNPNNGIFNVELNTIDNIVSLEIYNLLGVKVYSQPINTKYTQHQLQVETGVYLLNIKDEKGNKTVKKIIVQ